MTKFILASVLGIAAAILFGYAGGAVMATEIGRVSLAAGLVLVGFVGFTESARMISGSHRV